MKTKDNFCQQQAPEEFAAYTRLSPQEALIKYFGFNNFRAGQEEVIQRVLAEKHTLLVMPTGSGKSLTYQLPGILKPGLTLVISPLIALMKDQVDGLVEAGLPATYINSSLPNHQINHRLRAVLEGDIKILYIAPERLRNHQFTGILAKTKVGLLAVDEAHCISQWGHDFRPDYLQIGPIWQAMGRPTLLATTATATPAVQEDIFNLLQIEDGRIIVTGFNRPNLTFQVKHTPDDRTKMETLQAILTQTDGSIIVYTATRRNADDVADFIRHTLGITAHSYHGGLDRDWRTQVQNDFMANRVRVVVATNAFGMGVDKPDVRAVIHYNMPATMEAYYQEAGRAGRDGEPAQCILLFAPDDQRLQEWLINSDTPGYENLHQIYDLLINAAEDSEVYITNQELLNSSGFHPVKLRVTLNELERAGLIYYLGNQNSYTTWKVLPYKNGALEMRSKAIEKHAEARHQLLANMLDYAHLMTCRRQFMLKYFGDVTPSKAPNCCDNHTFNDISSLPRAVTPQDWYPLIILDTVRSFTHRPIGRNRLAQILGGSQSAELQNFGYNQHRFYGKLQHLSRKKIVFLIDELIRGRYLLMEGGKLPVLRTTSIGEEALERRATLPIHTPEKTTQINRKLSSDRSDTYQVTLLMFQEGHTPEQISEMRNLTQNTIYNHLARLIENNKIEIHQVVAPNIETQILRAIETVGSAARLTPIKEELPEEISYEQIKCVIAANSDLPKTLPCPDESKIAPAASAIELPSNSASADPQPDTIIIEAVVKLNGALGRTGLTKFLTGSQAGWLEVYASHALYGQLAHFSQRAVLDIIDALIVEGSLQITGGRRPKVISEPKKKVEISNLD